MAATTTTTTTATMVLDLDMTGCVYHRLTDYVAMSCVVDRGVEDESRYMA